MVQKKRGATWLSMERVLWGRLYIVARRENQFLLFDLEAIPCVSRSYNILPHRRDIPSINNYNLSV